MSISQTEMNPVAQSVAFVQSQLVVGLADGRTISVPVSWFPALVNATEAQRENWELLGEGEGIHWPELDEDLSVKGLLLGKH